MQKIIFSSLPFLTRNLSSLLVVAVVLTSCTKEIDVDLNSSNPQYVIEGYITNEAGPYSVKISKSVNFSESNNYPPVSSALVIISDNNGVKDTLDENSPGVYQTSLISGIPGRTYNLKIVADGKTFLATSTMPQVVNLDSLAFDVFANSGSSTDKEYLTRPLFTDPSTPGNAYQFIQTVNGKCDEGIEVLNDNTFNGLQNPYALFSPDAEINPGDTVAVEFRCIDKSTYDYFYTLSQIFGGPYGSIPTNPPNNITGNTALGIFSACTVQRKSRVAP